MRSFRAPRLVLVFGAACLLMGCRDTITINYPNKPPEVDFTGLGAQIALTGDPYTLPLDPYVSDDRDDVADLVFTVISVSTQDARGDFAVGTYNNTFSLLGPVSVTFSVADTEGLINIASFDVDVQRGTLPPPINFPPEAALSVWPTYPLVNQKTIFDGSATYDPNGDPLIYMWEFGDGDILGPTPQATVGHTYGPNYERLMGVTMSVSDGELSSQLLTGFNVWTPRALEPPQWQPVTSGGADWWEYDFVDVAVDDQGWAHACWYDSLKDILLYSYNRSPEEGGAWSAPVKVGSGAGWTCSIAAEGKDSDGSLQVHIAYVDTTTWTLEYMVWSAGAWNYETVDVAADADYVQVALDRSVAASVVHIGYVDWKDAGRVHHVAGTYSKWSAPEVVDWAIPNALALAMAVDGKGGIHFAYQHLPIGSLIVRYVTNAAGQWEGEDVLDVGSVFGAPGVGVSGQTVHLVAESEGNLLLHTSKRIGDVTWTPLEGAGYGSMPQVVIGTSGELYVCYRFMILPVPVIAQRMSDGSWTTAGFALEPKAAENLAAARNPLTGSIHVLGSVDAAAGDPAYILHTYALGVGLRTRAVIQGACDMPDLVADGNGAAHAVYRHQAGLTWSLRYGTNRTGLWTTEVIAESALVGFRERPRLVVDAGGVAHVVYATGWGQLWYARNPGGVWETQPVPGPVDPDYPCIAIDTSGGVPVVHIAYTDLASGFLYYVTGSWDNWGAPERPSAETPYTGLWYCDMALDSGGNPHILYHWYDGTANGYLRHVWHNGSVWSSPEDVFSTVNADAGKYPSVAIDLSGGDIIHVSFFDGTGGGGVLHMYKKGGNWYGPTVVAVVTWLRSSIALTSTGTPVVGYYDNALTKLCFAVSAGSGRWRRYTLNDDPVADHVPIAVDFRGVIHAAYGGTGGGNELRYVFGPLGRAQ